MPEGRSSREASAAWRSSTRSCQGDGARVRRRQDVLRASPATSRALVIGDSVLLGASASASARRGFEVLMLTAAGWRDCWSWDRVRGRTCDRADGRASSALRPRVSSTYLLTTCSTTPSPATSSVATELHRASLHLARHPPAARARDARATAHAAGASRACPLQCLRTGRASARAQRRAWLYRTATACIRGTVTPDGTSEAAACEGSPTRAIDAGLDGPLIQRSRGKVIDEVAVGSGRRPDEASGRR